jgi:hypothetical protein
MRFAVVALTLASFGAAFAAPQAAPAQTDQTQTTKKKHSKKRNNKKHKQTDNASK